MPPVTMPPDDPRPFDGQSSGPPAGASARNARIEVYEAHADTNGAWRLDASRNRSPASGGWLSAIKNFVLVALSLAVAAALWVFAFALMLVLLPLVAVAGWWLWRRLQALQRAHLARRNGAGPF